MAQLAVNSPNYLTVIVTAGALLASGIALAGNEAAWQGPACESRLRQASVDKGQSLQLV